MSAFADELDAQLDEIRFGVQAVTPASRDGAGAMATVTLLEGTTIDVSLSHRGVRSGDSAHDSVNSLLLNLSPCFAAAFNRSLADALRAVAEESGAEMVADVEEGEGATEEPFPLLPITSQQTLANIRSLAANARTVFIASYPKSGTTWLQNVVYQLVTGGAELDHISTFSPFLEADRTWADGGRVSDPAASHHQRLGWRAFNTHVLHAMLPASPAARLVYVVREPSDACCSMWHHFSHMAPEDGGFTGSLEQFVTQWVAGEIAFGTWRRHVGSWLAAAAADPRVLLLRYEDMIADLAGCVARLSAHLGLGYSDAELGKLLPRMTFAWMKAHEAAFAPTSVAWVDKGDGFSFVRRGKVGGGKEDLTAAQREAIERACWCADDCYSAVIGKEHTLAGLSP